MSFNKLSLEELVRTADEDFAFELTDDEKGSKKLALAAFTEAGLKFGDYLKANPDQAEKFAPQPAAVETPVEEGVVVTTVETEVVPVTAAVPDFQTEKPYLIKMLRDNPLYEVGRYRFTTDHPYVLVDAADAQRVLNNEGFRQAFPDELAEYYG